MIKKLILPVIVMLCVLCCSQLLPEADGESTFTLASCLNSHMVVQRDRPFTVWGTGTPGDTIKVEFRGNTANATVDANGDWKAELPASEYTCDPQTLDATSEKTGENIHLKNILVGDVYIVSGQSNSDLPINFTISAYPGYEKEITASDNIRIFAQYRYDAVSNKDKMLSPQKSVIMDSYCWKRSALGNVQTFSAIGYYFAKEYTKLSDVPVGVIMAGCSGSPLFQLMPPSLASELGYEIPATDEIPAGGIYNAFFEPFINIQFKSMIFYQGESDDGRSDVYAYQLKRYVEALRENFGFDFTFYNVQLSSHGDAMLNLWPNLPLVRNAQFKALSIIDNSYMVVSIDNGWRVGDADLAHPRYKKPIGERLARLALAVEQNVSTLENESSPMPKKLTWKDDELLIQFKYVAGGLKAYEGELKGFTLLKNGERLSTVASVVSEDTVSVKIDKYTEAVGYAMFHMAPIELANLVNGSDLPAPSFEFKLNETIVGVDEKQPNEKEKTVKESNNTRIILICICILLAVVLVTAVVIMLLRGRKKQS